MKGEGWDRGGKQDGERDEHVFSSVILDKLVQLVPFGI